MTANPVRPIDWEAVTAVTLDARFAQRLLDPADSETGLGVTLIRTPAGGGSPHGLHTHEFDQVFYLLEGEMTVELGGETSTAEAGSLIVLPKGIPHRNFNAGAVPTLHLSIAVSKPRG